MDFSPRFTWMAAVFPLMAVMTACNGPGADGSNNGGGAATPGGRQGSGFARVGESCSSADPSQICLGVKYVSYVDSKGTPVSPESEAVANIEATNRIWAQCGISFQIDEYLVVNPADYGLTYGGLAAEAQQNDIRNSFQNDTTLLVATTGAWNTTANGWARSPGSAPYGVVMDGGVSGGYPEIYAHELGHYLNLDHVGGDSGNLMYYAISKTPTRLTTDQCDEARRIATGYWVKMVR